MNKYILIGSFIIAIGAAAGQIIPWYVDRSERLAAAAQVEAERQQRAKAAAELLKEAQVRNELEQALREVELEEAQELAKKAVTEAKARFEAETLPRIAWYLTAYWKTLAELVSSESFKEYKAALSRAEAANESLSSAIMSYQIDPNRINGEKNRIQREKTAIYHANVLASVIDDYLSSRTVNAAAKGLADYNIELADASRKPESLAELKPPILNFYGITRQQYAQAHSELRELFRRHLGLGFDAETLRAANRAWLGHTILVRETFTSGSMKVEVGPKTPGNVVKPLCEDPKFIEMAKPVIGKKDACGYRLLDMSEPQED